MKIAIQGQAGSFHAIAARNLFGNEIELVYGNTFKSVFTSLKAEEVKYAVVAIENSLYGSINEVYDLLLTHQFTICAEVYEQIGLHLFGIKGSSISNITDVYSQAPALAEAEEYLENHLKQVTRHEYYDTAAAAQYVADEKNIHKAAVASKEAGIISSLELLASNIETHNHNYTRFIALSKNNDVATENNKTSITFRTQDKAGSLYEALGVFAKQQINLTKLESRPIIGNAWRYMYYVDFSAGINETHAKKALQELEAHATHIRILGSYPAGNTLIT